MRRRKVKPKTDIIVYEDKNIKVGYHKLILRAEHKTYNIMKYNRILSHLQKVGFKLKKSGLNIFIEKDFKDFTVRLTKNLTRKKWMFRFFFKPECNVLNAKSLIFNFLQFHAIDNPNNYVIEISPDSEELLKLIGHDRNFIFNLAKAANKISENGSLELIFNIDGIPIKIYWDLSTNEIRIEPKKVGPISKQKILDLLEAKDGVIKEEKLVLILLQKILESIHNSHGHLDRITQILVNQSLNFNQLTENFNLLSENQFLLTEYIHNSFNSFKESFLQILDMNRSMQMETIGHLIELKSYAAAAGNQKDQLSTIFQSIEPKNKNKNFIRKFIKNIIIKLIRIFKKTRKIW